MTISLESIDSVLQSARCALSNGDLQQCALELQRAEQGTTALTAFGAYSAMTERLNNYAAPIKAELHARLNEQQVTSELGKHVKQAAELASESARTWLSGTQYIYVEHHKGWDYDDCDTDLAARFDDDKLPDSYANLTAEAYKHLQTVYRNVYKLSAAANVPPLADLLQRPMFAPIYEAYMYAFVKEIHRAAARAVLMLHSYHETLKLYKEWAQDE